MYNNKKGIFSLELLFLADVLCSGRQNSLLESTYRQEVYMCAVDYHSAGDYASL